MSYISSAGFSPKLTIVKVHTRHTNLVPEIEVKVSYSDVGVAREFNSKTRKQQAGEHTRAGL